MDHGEILPQLLATRAAEAPDRVFLEEVDGASTTYSELHEAVLTWADAFRRCGVEPASNVLVMMDTAVDAVCAWIGLAWLPAVEVPVNTAYRGEMLSYIIEHSGAELAVISQKYLSRLAELEPPPSRLKTVVVPDAAGDLPDLPYRIVDRQEFLSGAVAAENLDGPGPADLAAIMYTSGTTGPSKGVMMPWGQMHATAAASIFTGDFGPDDAYYMPFPLFHISGKGPIYTFLLVGGRVVMRHSFRTERFWEDIEKYRCTTTLLIGAMANFLYRQDRKPIDADSPLHTVVMVPLIPELDDFRERFGVRVSTAFNMTETSVPIHSSMWDLANTESCGTTRPGYEVRIVDELDAPVPVGEIGELIVRTDEPWTLMVGYFAMPEATVKAWRNGWFHTGDAFRVDDAGNYYFMDRIKDTSRRRGENISSAEVEVLVGRHPDVLEVAAVAVPSEWGEDEVKVVVVLKPGRTLAAAELIDFLEPNTPRFMIPRFVEFVESLPKTPTEKVRKVALRRAGVTEGTWDREADRGS